jgi:hypothetical protein
MAVINLTPSILSSLRFVDKSTLTCGRYEFPDFLLIGPQRTGTTWLHQNMSVHPEIYMPPEKELYFFNLLTDKSNDHYSSDTLDWYSRKFTTNLWSWYRQNYLNVRHNGLSSLNFQIRKFMSNPLKGEATASYAVMDDGLINEVITLNPDIKVVILLRNPIDRAWSHAKKKLLQKDKKTFEEVGLSKFVEFYQSTYQIKCGQYTKIIESWSKFVRKDNIFLGFYDDIKRNPISLLQQIYGFLKLSKDESTIRGSMSEKIINPTSDDRIPDSHREILFDLFKEEISALNERFGLNWK